MKKYILISLSAIALVFLVVAVWLTNENKLKPTQLALPNSSYPLLPISTGPILNAETVSLEEAQARMPFSIPLLPNEKIKMIWASVLDTKEIYRSIAIEYQNGLLITIAQHPKPVNNWDEIISSNAPDFRKISVNGNIGMGADPNEKEIQGKNYKSPGVIDWCVNGLQIHIYSDTMTVDELLTFAETLPLPVATETPTPSPTDTPVDTSTLIPTDTPSETPTDAPTDTPTETPSPTP
jgi:hypothetical protein